MVPGTILRVARAGGRAGCMPATGGRGPSNDGQSTPAASAACGAGATAGSTPESAGAAGLPAASVGGGSPAAGTGASSAPPAEPLRYVTCPSCVGGIMMIRGRVRCEDHSPVAHTVVAGRLGE